VTPDGKTLATRGHYHNVVTLLDVASGKELHSFEAHSSHVDLLAVSPNGRTLASASHADEAVFIWNIPTGALRQKLPGHAGGVAALAFSPDGQTLATAAVLDHSISLWDAAAGKRLHQLPKMQPAPSPDRVLSAFYYKDVAVAYSPDGQILASTVA